MYLIIGLVAALFLSGAYTCSLIPGTVFYSPTQRTILAPIVFKATVLNSTTLDDPTGQTFDACVRIDRIFKSPFEIPRELCFGSFGIQELCLSYVFEGSDYVFFVNEDFTARYDGYPVSAISVTDELVLAVERGYCAGDPPLQENCVSPIIEVESFEPMNRVLEGRNAYVFCRATGTFPMITNWFRGGELVLEKQRGTMLKITDATMYDTGRYSCTVKNPAGEATAETYVQILSSACGGHIAVDENTTATIQSPEYPWPYRKAKSCSWRVCPPQGMKLEFNFTTFDLRTFDKLEIINECDRHLFPWRKYCGSKVTPGMFVSRCNTTCMQVVLNSGILTNRVATGFQAAVTATDKDSTEYNLTELFCSSDLVARVNPTVRFEVLVVHVKVLEIFKQDEPAIIFTDHEIPIKHDFTITDMFGCSMEISVDIDSEYYIFASYEEFNDGAYVMDIAVDPSSTSTPANFVQRMNMIKEDPPQCEALPAK